MFTLRKFQHFLKTYTKRFYQQKNNSNQSSNNEFILGIETSCDDTGCAIVDTEGNLLGEALNSQHLIHLKNGGIIPPIAQDLHRKSIENVVNEAITKANVNFNDISAIATTVKPGLPLSLMIGTKYGKYLCRLHKKPFIPIHHMEAHALTARMHDKNLQFPYLVLLISGGHSLLAIVQDVDKFKLLGESMEFGPGEAFDKVARRMKLKNLPEYSNLNGGQAIELAASKATNPLEFQFTIPLTVYKDCNFSFAGLRHAAERHLMKEEAKYDVPPDGVIPTINNLCASFQLIVARHLCHRTQRAMEFIRRRNLIPTEQQTLVVSGGTACNNFIANALQIVCDNMDYKFIRTPPKLCMDNGVMIAWNGVERWRSKLGIYTEFEHIGHEADSQLGESLIEKVKRENISCKWIRLTKLTLPENNNVKENVEVCS